MKKRGDVDVQWMRKAIDLAVKGEGLTRPNPPVGAVVLRDGRVVGEGFHPSAGKPHAEVYALREAGASARGSTLYVTLEPCSTKGRTPACTDQIIAAGVSHVVYGCVDPNPQHAGRADAVLRKAGIAVTRNVLRDSCETLIRPFATLVIERRPYVTLKLACSLDGRIADYTGGSRWITGSQARKAVQELRRSADGIMIGAETLRKDNPSLLPRPAYGRRPWRIVVSGRRALPKHAAVFTGPLADQTVVYKCSAGGRSALSRMMSDLADRNLMHVVCEGGGVLAESLLKAGLIDQVWMFYAPKVLGGRGRPSIGGKGWRLADAPGFTMVHVEPVGEDLLVVLRRGAGKKLCNSPGGSMVG